MSTKVEILNKALTQIGAAPVTSIDDDSTNAKALKRVYDSSLRSILAVSKWNFATKRALLSLSTDTLAWYDTGEGIIYNKPSDVIRIFGVNSPTAIWREEGDYIISDTSGLGLRYVYFVEDTTKFPSYFVDAFVDRLSADIAYTIVNSASLGQTFKELYISISLPNAMSLNAQAGTQQFVKDDAWENARFGNVSPQA